MIARPDGTVRVYRYWRAALRPEPAPWKSTGADILAALRDSVAVHLRSDAPVGAFLFSRWHQIYVERVYDPVALGWECRALEC